MYTRSGLNFQVTTLSHLDKFKVSIRSLVGDQILANCENDASFLKPFKKLASTTFLQSFCYCKLFLSDISTSSLTVS